MHAGGSEPDLRISESVDTESADMFPPVLFLVGEYWNELRRMAISLPYGFVSIVLQLL